MAAGGKFYDLYDIGRAVRRWSLLGESLRGVGFNVRGARELADGVGDFVGGEKGLVGGLLS